MFTVICPRPSSILGIPLHPSMILGQGRCDRRIVVKHGPWPAIQMGEIKLMMLCLIKCSEKGVDTVIDYRSSHVVSIEKRKGNLTQLTRLSRGQVHNGQIAKKRKLVKISE